MNERQQAEVGKALLIKFFEEFISKSPKTKTTIFNGLAKDEQLIASVVLQGTDLVDYLKEFVETLEEVDSYIDSFAGFEKLDKDAILNAIITDALNIGGFGYSVSVKSLQK